MQSSLNLDYYYGNEAEQYSFYRIPKALMTEARYRSVSMEARVLYGLLLDRMSLSVKNGWMDNDRRVYIYFTQEDAMNLMNCGKDKATKLFRELEKDGVGLIERKKQGQGRPARIYVKNFIQPPEPPQPQTPPIPEPEYHQPVPQDSPAVQTAEKPRSAPLETRSAGSEISAPNKTDKNNTKWNDTDPSILPPPPASAYGPLAGTPRDGMRMDEMESYRALIKENIDYDLFLHERPYSMETLEGYVELMVEVCCSRRDFIRIGGEEIAAGVVKSRFLKLNHEHIVYVLDSLSQNTTLVRNIKAYTLAALYNAPVTMEQYYASLVSHDMAQERWGQGG